MVFCIQISQLLGKDSHDIDIALDNMLGKKFCEKVNEYLKSIGEETSGVGVIQRYACGLISNLLSGMLIRPILCTLHSRELEAYA